MATALTRFSWRRITRHRARSALTVATIAAAVLGVWLFAAPRDFDAAMNEQVVDDRLHDAILRPDGVPLTDADVDDLRATEGVEGLDVFATHVTEMRVGARTLDAWLVGVRDFDDQSVNVVDADVGAVPRAERQPVQALTDPVNSRSGWSGSLGDTVMLRSASGEFVPVDVVGEGSSVYFAHNASEWIPVLYLPAESVWELAPFDGLYTQVHVRFDSRDPAALGSAVGDIRDRLEEAKPLVRYNALIEVRPEDEWPGEDDFDRFLVLFWVIAAVSLLSAVALVSSTMATLVREQAREIGVMKAVGARRRQIVGSYVGTSSMLGAAGTVLGVVVGLPVANLLTGFLGGFQGIDPGWRVSWLALVLSVVVGLGVTVLASLPPVLRGTRVTVRAAFGEVAAGERFGDNLLERSTTRLARLPRHAQIGVRSAARRPGRSLSTAVQVSLAVGVLLGFTSLVVTILQVSDQSRSAEGGDIEVYSSGSGRTPDARAEQLISAIDGVKQVQPTVYADLLVGETDTYAWGLPADPVYAYELAEGRWFTAEEDASHATVAVVGPALANMYDLAVGDDVRVEAVTGAAEFEVVGIDTTMVGDGRAIFAPIETVLGLADRAEASWFWIETTGSDAGEIDRVALAIGEELDRYGYGYELDLRYLEREAAAREDRMIITIIMALGIPVVAMGMIGMVSAMSTSVLERRREIGVMRSIGARSRDIRRIFRAEAVTLLIVGWLVGIGVGYLVARIILRAMNESFSVSFDLRYPWWALVVALAVVLVVGAIVLRRPLRRAGRIPPSESLRYE